MSEASQVNGPALPRRAQATSAEAAHHDHSHNMHHGSESPLASRVQELVRLDNPRPGLLRAHNEYVSVQLTGGSSNNAAAASSSASFPGSSYPQASSSSSSPSSNATAADRLSSPTDFDRIKIHHHQHQQQQQRQHRTDVSPIHHQSPGRRRCSDRELRELPPELPTRRQAAGAFRPLCNPGPSTASSSQHQQQHCASMRRWTMASDGQQQQTGVAMRRAPLPLTTAQAKAQQPAHVTTSQPIICGRCGRCKCTACRQPRPLPSFWLCHRQLYCDCSTCIDCVSCMCCVRACLFHTAQSEADAPLLDDQQLFECDAPTDNQCCLRYACLSLAHLLLPCIWSYWPLKLCGVMTECGYSAYCSRRGCQCPRGKTPPAQATDSMVVTVQPSASAHLLQSFKL